MFCSYSRRALMTIIIATLMSGCVTTDQYGNIRPDQAQLAGAIASVAAGALVASASSNPNADRQPAEPYAANQRHSSTARSGNSQQRAAPPANTANANPAMSSLFAAAAGQAVTQSANKKASKSNNKRIQLPNGQPAMSANQAPQVAHAGQKPNRLPQTNQPARRPRPTE